MTEQQLTPDQAHFIDKFTDFGLQSGLTRSVARVLGLLVICYPPKQTALDIQHALGLSAGSVSTATTLLVRVGLIDQMKLPGQRRLQYEVKPDSFKRAVEQRVHITKAAAQIAEEGLEFDPHNERLSNMRDIYMMSEAALIDVLKKLDALYKN